MATSDDDHRTFRAIGLPAGVSLNTTNGLVPGTDQAGGPLTHRATGLPPGMGINPNSGAGAGSFAPGSGSGNLYTVTGPEEENEEDKGEEDKGIT